MQPVESAESRANLQFAEIAKSAFAFLHELGFDVVSEEMTRLHYESSAVFVNIFHARDGLGFRVGPLASPKEWLTDHEIEVAAGAPREPLLRPRTFDQINIDVPKLAQRLRTYGARALQGDPSMWAAASELRKAYTAEMGRPATPPQN